MKINYDIHGAAGNIYSGRRTVKKAGRIYFDSSVYESKFLIPYIGEQVSVVFDGDSPFALGPIIVKDIIRQLVICKIEKPLPK